MLNIFHEDFYRVLYLVKLRIAIYPLVTLEECFVDTIIKILMVLYFYSDVFTTVLK